MRRSDADGLFCEDVERQPGISQEQGMFQTLLRIPFAKEVQPAVGVTDEPIKIQRYLGDIRQQLDSEIYGMENARDVFSQICARWITNPGSTSTAFALQGPPGCGKTLAVQAFAKALGRPFHLVALGTLGGARDSSYLIGHDYTYLNSQCGLLVNTLIRSECMNPIIFFDELDKVSESNLYPGTGNHWSADPPHRRNAERPAARYISVRHLSGLLQGPFRFLLQRRVQDRPHSPGQSRNFEHEEIHRDGEGGHRETPRPSRVFKKKIGMDPARVEWADDLTLDIIRRFTNEEAGVRSMKKCIKHCILQLNLMLLSGVVAEQCDIDLKAEPIRITTRSLTYLLRDVTTKNRAYLSMYC
jgi:ATP-dependent Lon protease